STLSLQGAYHGATMDTSAVGGSPDQVKPYGPYQWTGFTKAQVPYPFRDRGEGPDAHLVRRSWDALAAALRDPDPETAAAVIVEQVLGAAGCIIPPLGW